MKPVSAYNSLKARMSAIAMAPGETDKNASLEKSAQKSQAALGADIDKQMKSSGTPLTGGDAKLRAELGDTLNKGGKDDTNDGLGPKTDMPAGFVLKPGVNPVSLNDTTKKVTTTEKKAKFLKAAEKLASLGKVQKVASVKPLSIIEEIYKEASLTSNPTGVTYAEGERIVAALAAGRMHATLTGLDKRAQLDPAGTKQQLSPADIQQIMQMAAMVPEEGKEMSPEEQQAILSAAPEEVIHDSAGIVAGNDGEEEPMPEPTEEELAQLEGVEGDLEGGAPIGDDGDGDADGAGDADGDGGEAGQEGTVPPKKEEEKEASLQRHEYLLNHISGKYRGGQKIAALPPPVSAEAFYMRKEAALLRTIEGLKGVIASQDLELNKQAQLQEKVASLEKAASAIPTISADKVNSIVAQAARAGLVVGSETELQNVKLAMLHGVDGVLNFTGGIIERAESAKANRMGSIQKVASANRPDDMSKQASVEAAQAKLRSTIIS